MENYDEIYRSTWEPRAHLAEGKTRAQTKILDAYEKKHDLVALLSEGEAENVASCLLDQSKNNNNPYIIVYAIDRGGPRGFLTGKPVKKYY
eukprot:SAG11_NODE_291_length_11180_cov_102.040155_9_plen_91_part_00